MTRLRAAQAGRSHTCSGCHGQVAMEFLFVVGFAFLLLVPLILVFYTESASMEDEVISAQAQHAMNKIIDAADTVYYLGPPSRQTFTLYFPEKIQQVMIYNDTITFTVDSSYGGAFEYTGYASTNLTGTLDTYDGTHRIAVQATESSVIISEG